MNCRKHSHRIGMPNVTRQLIASIGIAASAIIISPGATAQQAPSTTASPLQQVEKAVKMAEQGRLSTACNTIIAPSELLAIKGSGNGQRAKLLADAGFVYLQCDRAGDAYVAFKESTRLAPDGWALYNLVVASSRSRPPHDTAEALIALATHDPMAMTGEAAGMAWTTYLAIDDDIDLKVRLLQACFDASQRQMTTGRDPMWVELAVQHLAAGKPDRARAVLAAVVEPRSVVMVRADRRFDPVVDFSDVRFTPAARANDYVDRAALRAEIAPKDPVSWYALAIAKLTLGDDEGVINDITRVLQTAGPPDPSVKNMADLRSLTAQGELLHLRAVAHARSGDLTAAIADQGQAAALEQRGEYGHRERLNSAHLVCLVGEPKKALDILATLMPPFSPSDRELGLSVASCIFGQEGNREVIDKLVESFSERGEVSSIPVLQALLWAGDIEAAEAMLLELLDAECCRRHALLFAQSYRRTEGLKGREIFDRNRAALLARPAVLAKINAVGRIEESEFYLDSAIE